MAVRVAPLVVDRPDGLVRRCARAVPASQRRGFVRRLVERALPTEEDVALNAEMAEWEQATT